MSSKARPSPDGTSGERDELFALEQIAALLDGSLDPAEREQLLILIEANEDLYRIFVGAIELLTSEASSADHGGETQEG